MTEERLISGIEVTSGEVCDGKMLKPLSRNRKRTGSRFRKFLEIWHIRAWKTSGIVTKKKSLWVAKTNPLVANAAEPKNDGFKYNKDAGLVQCPAGELALRVRKRQGKYGNQYFVYFFNSKKCHKCACADKCRVGRSKTQTYCVTVKSQRNHERLDFEKSKYFNERLKIRNRIEEKNGELKRAHGLRTADSTGLSAMWLQSYFTAFAANIKKSLN